MRYWKQVNSFGVTTAVEYYSHNQKIKDAIEITKSEYDSYIAALPKPVPIPARDILAEFDDLKAKLKVAGINV